METYKDLPQWVLLDERRRVEIFNDLGLLDQNELAVCTALTEYARKYQTSYLPLQGLYKFVYEHGLRNNLNALKNEGNIVALLKKCYLALHKRNYCTADRKEGNIVGLILTGPQDLNPDQVQSILQKIKKDFADMDADLALPFPSADFLPKNGISPNTLCVLPVNDLSDRRIRETQQKGIPLTKVTFQGTNPILIPTDELNRLRDRAFNKLKYTLSKSRDLNALIVMKLKKQFPKLANINQSEDFFRHERDNQFWAVLASEILNYVESNEKEKALAQSAELVKYTSILESEDEHKKTHDDKSLEIILNILASYPVAFTKGQILQLREKHSYLKL